MERIRALIETVGSAIFESAQAVTCRVRSLATVPRWVTKLIKTLFKNRIADWDYFIPKRRPSLFRLPDFVVGIPVALATFLLAEVTPSAFLRLKESPGILKDFLAI